KKRCSAIGRRSWSRGTRLTPCSWMKHWPKLSVPPPKKPGRKWTRGDSNLTPGRSEGVEYKIRLDTLVRRSLLSSLPVPGLASTMRDRHHLQPISDLSKNHHEWK